MSEPLHHCDRSCVCPSCEKPLLYSAAFNQHACSDPSCKYAAGTPDQLYLWMERRYARLLAKEELIVEKKIIKASRSLVSDTTVEGRYGLVRTTTGGAYRTIIDYTKDEARLYAEALLAAADDAGQTPTWEHQNVTYDLTMSWRSPHPWTGCHWTWTGEYTPSGVPLMTPHGTGDEDLIGTKTPFDQVLAAEKEA